MEIISAELKQALAEFHARFGLTSFSSKLQDYRIDARLGKGATSSVFSAEFKQQDPNLPLPKTYALKVMDKAQIKQKNLQVRVQNEIEIQIFLNSFSSKFRKDQPADLFDPTLVMYHCFEDEANVYLLLEHCEGRELFYHIQSLKAKKTRLQEQQVQRIFAQVAYGVFKIQGLGIMHRDLKLGNIMLTEMGEIKIIDFGLAVKLEVGQKGEQKTMCGTPNYISPEVLCSQPYGLQSDLWSLGCILYALLTGSPPFECPTVQLTLLNIKKGKFKLPEYLSEQASDLVQNLLNSNPDHRIEIRQVMMHPFLEAHLAPLYPELKEQLRLEQEQHRPPQEEQSLAEMALEQQVSPQAVSSVSNSAQGAGVIQSQEGKVKELEQSLKSKLQTLDSNQEELDRLLGANPPDLQANQANRFKRSASASGISQANSSSQPNSGHAPQGNQPGPQPSKLPRTHNQTQATSLNTSNMTPYQRALNRSQSGSIRLGHSASKSKLQEHIEQKRRELQELKNTGASLPNLPAPSSSARKKAEVPPIQPQTQQQQNRAAADPSSNPYSFEQQFQTLGKKDEELKSAIRQSIERPPHLLSSARKPGEGSLPLAAGDTPAFRQRNLGESQLNGSSARASSSKHGSALASNLLMQKEQELENELKSLDKQLEGTTSNRLKSSQASLPGLPSPPKMAPHPLHGQQPSEQGAQPKAMKATKVQLKKMMLDEVEEDVPVPQKVIPHQIFSGAQKPEPPPRADLSPQPHSRQLPGPTKAPSVLPKVPEETEDQRPRLEIRKSVKQEVVVPATSSLVDIADSGVILFFLPNSMTHPMKPSSKKARADPSVPSGNISFNKEGQQVSIELMDQKKQLIIDPGRNRLSVLYLNAVDPISQKPKVVENRLNRLSSKLKAWMTYAHNFISILYSKTPWLSLRCDKANLEPVVSYNADFLLNYKLLQLAAKQLVDLCTSAIQESHTDIEDLSFDIGNGASEGKEATVLSVCSFSKQIRSLLKQLVDAIKSSGEMSLMLLVQPPQDGQGINQLTITKKEKMFKVIVKQQDQSDKFIQTNQFEVDPNKDALPHDLQSFVKLFKQLREKLISLLKDRIDQVIEDLAKKEEYVTTVGQLQNLLSLRFEGLSPEQEQQLRRTQEIEVQKHGQNLKGVVLNEVFVPLFSSEVFYI